MAPRARGLTHLEVLVLLLAGSFVVSLAALARHSSAGRRHEAGCRKNLEKIGIAAILYCDDKRFFPHSGNHSRLAGGVESDEASLAAEKLIRFGYLTDAALFVCPASLDEPGREGPRRAPLVVATDLSYGYSRRGLSMASMSISPVFGDKARRIAQAYDSSGRNANMRGQHAECLVVACLDAHVIRVSKDSPTYDLRTVTATGGLRDGFLGVLGE